MLGSELAFPGESNKKLQRAGGESSEVHGSEDDGSIGSVIQFLIGHGHSWTEIKSYTLSQLGLFAREATKLDETKRKERITAAWLGFNADHKNLTKILESAVARTKSSDPEDKLAEHKKNWNNLAKALRGLR